MKLKTILLAFAWISVVQLSSLEGWSQPSADTFRIKGVLVSKDGSPLKGKEVIAYPLDGKGTAISVNTLNDKGVMVLWNPKVESDAEGRFTINLPCISRIGKDAITEVALGLNEPSGGIVTATVLEIQYADPNKKAEYGFVRKAGGLSLLRKGSDVLKVKIDEKAKEVDLGKIVVE